MSAVAPEGASIEIVTPADGATVSGARDGLVPVQVELAAMGVKVGTYSECAEATGHFQLAVEAINVPDCGHTSSRRQFHELRNGAKQLTLMLEPPGRYSLTATFVAGNGARYDELVAEAQITLVGALIDAGEARCF